MARQTPVAQRMPQRDPAGETPPALELSSEEIRRQIAEAAYYRAANRGFEPGGDIEDWLQAEAQIAQSLSRGSELG